MPIAERGKSGLWIIVYSMSGYGKTTLAAGLMRLCHTLTGRPGLYVDFDGSAEDIPSTVPFDLYDPTPPQHIIDQEPSQVRVDGYEKEATASVIEALKRKSSVYVADTCSTFGRNLFLSVPRPMWGEKGRDMRPVYAEAQTRFLQWAARMPELQRQGTHVLWLCHETVNEVGNEKGPKEIKGGPDVISSKFIKIVPGFSRVTLRLDVVPDGPATVTRVIRPEGDSIYIAKDRFNAFDPRGVRIGVSSLDGDKRKDPSVFEEECLQMGEKVWRTLLKALERRQQAGAGLTQPQTPSDVAALTAASGGKETTHE